MKALVPIRFTEVNLLLKQANVKLKRMQKSKTVDTAMVMSTRLFLVGVIKLLRYFNSYKPPDGGAAITYRTFEFKYWAEASQGPHGRILKAILHRKRYANLSRTFVTLKKLNKDISPETEGLFFILLLMFLLETYALLMYMATATVDPSFLNSSAVKTATRSMLAFRRKMNIPFEYYDVLSTQLDSGVLYKVNAALVKMKPFLNNNLRVLISYNKGLV